jgi:hypothetical protein
LPPPPRPSNQMTMILRQEDDSVDGAEDGVGLIGDNANQDSGESHEVAAVIRQHAP